MCGFVGIIGPVDKNQIFNMLDLISYRGPDDRGFYCDNKHDVNLGHVRLSILDKNGGIQPMLDDISQCAVVYNGEIYNANLLRKELEELGEVFKTKNSDTEVLLRGYSIWGHSILHKINGMFSFAIYDKKNELILIARDKFGQKPLYFEKNKEYFKFSSELKPLLVGKNGAFEISKDALIKYYAYGFIPAPLSIIDGIYKLKPNSFAIYNLKNKEIKFEDINTLSDNKNDSFKDAAIRIKSLISKSVEMEVNNSDVKVAMLLSGGLDSSIILSEIIGTTKCKNIEAFNICFDEKSYDESKYATIIADFYKIKLNSYRFTQEVATSILEEVLCNIDEPFADPSILPSYYLCKKVSSSYKVAIGGDGGDEIFAGYDPFIALKYAVIYQKFIPKFIHKKITKILKIFPPDSKNMSFHFKINKFLNGLDCENKICNAVWIGPLKPEELSNLFNKDINTEKVYSEAIETWKDENTILQNTLNFYQNVYLPNNILYKSDRAGMLNSVEIRSPFLDNELINYAFTIDSKFLFKNETKYILKYIYKKVLPKSIVYRKKKGFGIPISDWVKDWYISYNFGNIPFIDKRVIEKMYTLHINKKSDYRQALWATIVLDKYLFELNKIK